MTEAFDMFDPGGEAPDRQIKLRECQVANLGAAICRGGTEIIGCTNLESCQSSLQIEAPEGMPDTHGMASVIHQDGDGKVTGLDVYGPVQWDYTHGVVEWPPREQEEIELPEGVDLSERFRWD